MKREFIMRKTCVILATLSCSNVNAEWGQQWGSMVWGQSSTNIPMMGGFGQLIFFGLLLVIGAFVTKRWGLIKTLPAIAVLSLMPLMVDADEIQLNTFQNGQVADADEVNENFSNLKNAIGTIGSLSNIVSRQAVINMSVITVCSGINGDGDFCYTQNMSNGSVSCINGEVALSGGCEYQNPNNSTGEPTIFSNYTKNNTHYCAGYSNVQILIAYVNCIEQ